MRKILFQARNSLIMVWSEKMLIFGVTKPVTTQTFDFYQNGVLFFDKFILK